jgi:hypothetical protein
MKQFDSVGGVSFHGLGKMNGQKRENKGKTTKKFRTLRLVDVQNGFLFALERHPPSLIQCFLSASAKSPQDGSRGPSVASFAQTKTKKKKKDRFPAPETQTARNKFGSSVPQPLMLPKPAYYLPTYIQSKLTKPDRKFRKRFFAKRKKRKVTFRSHYLKKTTVKMQIRRQLTDLVCWNISIDSLALTHEPISSKAEEIW